MLLLHVSENLPTFRAIMRGDMPSTKSKESVTGFLFASGIVIIHVSNICFASEIISPSVNVFSMWFFDDELQGHHVTKSGCINF